MVALFGRPATSGGGGGGDAVPAQLQVYKSNHNPQSPSSNSKLPCYSINLESSTITAAPIAKKTSHYKFSLTDADEGKSYEFKTNHECDYKVWVNRLKFLTKFPYSSIPDSGLKYDHPMGFDKLLDSKLYNTGIYFTAIDLGHMKASPVFGGHFYSAIVSFIRRVLHQRFLNCNIASECGPCFQIEV